LGLDGVFEQQGSRKSSTDFRRGRRLGQRDHLIDLGKPKCKPDWMSQQEYELAPESLVVCELMAGGKLLVTTLRCPKQTTKAALKSALSKLLARRVGFSPNQTTLGMVFDAFVELFNAPAQMILLRWFNRKVISVLRSNFRIRVKAASQRRCFFARMPYLSSENLYKHMHF
jgi:hypothetical protein